MNKHNLLVGTVLAGTLALGTIGIADAGGRGNCGYGMRAAHHAKMQRHMARFLRLDEKQRDQMFKIMHESRPAKYEKMKQLRGIRKEMTALVHSDKFNTGKVRALAQRKAAIIVELTMMKARTRSQIYQMLTPEQRDRVNRMSQRMHDRSGRHHRRHGGDHGGRRHEGYRGGDDRGDDRGGETS